MCFGVNIGTAFKYFPAATSLISLAPRPRGLRFAKGAA